MCRLIGFLHIEKTAGTTIHEILRNNYWSYYWDSPYIYEGMDENQRFYLKSDELCSIVKKIPKFKAFGGHSIRFFENYGKVLNKKIFYFTMVRHPVDRYMSNYFFQKNHLDINTSFEEHLDNNYFNNFMTKKICGKEDVNEAKKILSKYDVFVGLVEYFDESLVLLQRKIKKINDKFNIDYESQNINTKKDTTIAEELKNRYRERIIKNNALDLQLYNYLSEIFQNYIQEENDFGQELEIFQRKNANYRFSKIKRKFLHRFKRLYLNKLEILHRDTSERKLSI